MKKCLFSPWTHPPRSSGRGAGGSSWSPRLLRMRLEMEELLSPPAARSRVGPPVLRFFPDECPARPLPGGPPLRLSPPQEHRSGRGRERCSSSGSLPAGGPAASGRREEAHEGRRSWQRPPEESRWTRLTGHTSWCSPPTFYFCVWNQRQIRVKLTSANLWKLAHTYWTHFGYWQLS